MLIRILVENYLSFGNRQELLLTPNPRITKHNHHITKIGSLKLLRSVAIYGPNGSGKSNFMKALSFLEKIVVNGELPKKNNTVSKAIRSSALSNNQIFEIDFVANDVVYSYHITINEAIIRNETLKTIDSKSGQESLVFTRLTSSEGVTSLSVDDQISKTEADNLLISVIEKNLIKPSGSVLKVFAELEESKNYKHIINAFNWFDKEIIIIFPQTPFAGITNLLETNDAFREFANGALKAMGLGLTRFEIQQLSVDEFLSEGNSLPKGAGIDVGDGDFKSFGDSNMRGAEILLEKEGERTVVKRLNFFHESGCGENPNLFHFYEESDGTIRLFNLLPALFNVFASNGVVFVDEIERSIHPTLVKRLFVWLSESKHAQGQIVFTTHESNLLDRNIFRHDEIWFTEKDQEGNTKLYSLNDHGEHHTIDIRKGYLAGRYGAIPHLSRIGIEN